MTTGAIQQMPDLKRVSSVNADGLSQITVELENTVREHELAQYWDLLRRKMDEVTQEFINEVEVCCDLNHPNLTRLLGYAERPDLMLVQELLHSAVDHMLCEPHASLS